MTAAAETHRPTGWFDIAENAIPPDQRIGDNPAVEMILSPVAVVEPRGEWLRSPNALLVTQSQLVFAYKRGLGRRGVVHNWFRDDFSKYGVGLYLGAGPLFACSAIHDSRGLFQFLFGSKTEADALGEYFANG